jgi:two-component system sensor histidine kinase RpfC
VNTPRRLFGILVDAGAITFALFYAGAGGATLVGAYLFFILGNGFRYGRVYLQASQALCLIGFSVAVFAVPWWRQQDPAVPIGWMVAMVIIPPYVGALAARMKADRVRAEQALKESIEQQGAQHWPSNQTR